MRWFVLTQLSILPPASYAPTSTGPRRRPWVCRLPMFTARCKPCSAPYTSVNTTSLAESGRLSYKLSHDFVKSRKIFRIFLYVRRRARWYRSPRLSRRSLFPGLIWYRVLMAFWLPRLTVMQHRDSVQARPYQPWNQPLPACCRMATPMPGPVRLMRRNSPVALLRSSLCLHWSWCS